VGALESRRRAKRHSALDDDMAMLDLTLDLPKELALPASVIWATISKLDRIRDWCRAMEDRTSLIGEAVRSRSLALLTSRARCRPTGRATASEWIPVQRPTP